MKTKVIKSRNNLHLNVVIHCTYVYFTGVGHLSVSRVYRSEL